MSWATVIEEKEGVDNSHVVVDEQTGSEEAILHGLRTAYNGAMQTIGLHPVCSGDWVQALAQLESISNSCISYVDSIPSAKIQLQEMSYLAKRNRIECMAKDPSGDSSTCYQLILDTISVMMELEKEDLSLILLAARYAKKLDDLWTYKQLILLHQHNLPYMYKDLIMADFERTVNQEWNASKPSVTLFPEKAIVAENGKLGHESHFFGSAIRAGAQDQFESFISQKILLGEDLTKNIWMDGFSQEWLTSVEESVNKQASEMVIASEEIPLSEAPGQDNEQMMTVDEESDSTIKVSDAAEGTTCLKEPAQEETPVTKPDFDAEAAGRVSRRSGRAAKKTDPAAWEDRALQTAIEASKAVSRVPSQSQLSRGTSGSEECSNISEIKKLLDKSSGLNAWSSFLEDDSEGLRALYYTFALPTSILEISAMNSTAQKDVSTPVTHATVAEGAHSENGDSDVRSIFSDVAVAALFQAFVRLVLSNGALSDLMNLYVAFIQTVAGAIFNKNGSRDLCADLDRAVLHSWRCLTSMHQITTAALLTRLNESEEILLLECALSVVQRQSWSSSHVNEHGLAFEILQHLLPHIVSAHHSATDVDAAPAPFWQRFSDETLQLRALWAAVLACRFFGADTLGSIAGSDATAVDLLAVMLTKFDSHASTPPSIWLPHVNDKQQQRISAQTCRDLQDTIRYEAEVRDLLSSFTASKAWVQGVLGQIRLGERLQSLLGFRQQQQQSKDSDAGAPQSIPLLLLEACRTLKDYSLWVEVAAVVLSAVIGHASETDGILSGSWMAELLTSLLSNLPASPPTADPALVASLSTKVAMLLYVHGTQLTATADSHSIVTSCIRIHEEIDRTDGNTAATRIVFSRTVMHVLIAQSQRALRSSADAPASPDSTLSLLRVLWSQVDKVITTDSVALVANLSELSWGCLTRLVVEVWDTLDAELNNGFRTVLLSVLLKLLVGAPCLAASCKGELLVHCHFEILDNSLHRPDMVAHSSRKKRKRDQPSAPSSRVAPVTQLLCAALEELVFDESFETNLAQRVQREITFVLGQVYFYTFGFPMVPLDSSSSDDEDSVDKGHSSARLDNQDPALLSKLFAFSKVCIKGGWVNKAEIRASLLMLAQAEVFKSTTDRPGARAISEHIFTEATDSASLFETLQAVDSRGGEEVAESEKLVQLVGAQLFSTLLQLGLPPAEIDDEGAGPSAEGVTSLLAQCDLGLFLRDRNQGAVVELSLQDLAFSPLRFTSWHLLLVQLMETFNAVMDELQKLILPDALPAACYDFVLPAYLALLHPPASNDTNDISLWRPSASIPVSAAVQLLDAAVSAVQSACGGADLVACFENTLTAETFFNLHRTAESSDYEAHLRKICHLVGIRNACFHVYQKVSHFMDEGVSSGRIELSDDEEHAMWHAQAEIAVMTLSNAAKCFPKGTDLRNSYKMSSLALVQQENCFDNDLYALTCSAKLQLQLAKQGSDSNGATRLQALTTCSKAVQVLKGENAKVYSKPVRLSVLYQVSSICLKATLHMIKAREMNKGTLEQELSAIEECMAALLPTKATNTVAVPVVSVSEASATSTGPETSEQTQEEMEISAETEPVANPPPSTTLEVRMWTALQRSFAGLKECRRVDAFDFKSVYRIARGISELSEMLQRSDGDASVSAESLMSLLELLGIRELNQSAALEELARVFDRKRSQIVAMWCVENAVSPWEKILVRISQFDTLRKKFIDEYLRLAVVCNHLEVVLDVIAFALSALKHATAVVLHTLQSGVASFRTIVLSLLNEPHPAYPSAEEQDSEMFVTATDRDSDDRTKKRETLCKEATRWLHVMFELHHQLRPIASELTQAHLDDIILALYPHSSVFVTPVPVSSAVPPATAGLVADESMPMEVAVQADQPALATNPDTATTPQASVPEALTATEVLTLCADKWGRPKQPRSDLGKRAKGYFTTRSAAATATSSATAAVAAATTDEGDAASGLAAPVDSSAGGENAVPASSAVDDAARMSCDAAESMQVSQEKEPIRAQAIGAEYDLSISAKIYANEASADDEEDIQKSARL
eukprot:gene10701-12486_t